MSYAPVKFPLLQSVILYWAVRYRTVQRPGTNLLFKSSALVKGMGRSWWRRPVLKTYPRRADGNDSHSLMMQYSHIRK